MDAEDGPSPAGRQPVKPGEPGKPDEEQPIAATRVVRRAADPADDRSEVSADDSDIGWGERASEGAREAWYQRERPPHHGD